MYLIYQVYVDHMNILHVDRMMVRSQQVMVGHAGPQSLVLASSALHSRNSVDIEGQRCGKLQHDILDYTNEFRLILVASSVSTTPYIP